MPRRFAMHCVGVVATIAMACSIANASVVLGDSSHAGGIEHEASLYAAQLGDATLYRFRDDLDVSGDPLAVVAGAITPLFSTTSPFDTMIVGDSDAPGEVASSDLSLRLVRETGFDRAAESGAFFSLIDADGLNRRLATFGLKASKPSQDWRSVAAVSLPSPIGYATDPSVAGQLGVAILAGRSAGAQLFPAFSAASARIRAIVSEDPQTPREIPAGSLVPEPSSWVIWALVAGIVAWLSLRRR